MLHFLLLRIRVIRPMYNIKLLFATVQAYSFQFEIVYYPLYINLD